MNKTPYDKTQRVCAYGQFSSVPAGYTITDKDSDFTVVPSVYPFVYTPQVTAWDLPE